MTENNDTQPQNINPNQLAERLADTIWKMTVEWGDFAKTSVALPLTQAVDEIGTQLAMSQGRKPVKEHLQHVSNARKALTPASYWLQRATARGLIDQDQSRQLADQMAHLATHLDKHTQTVIKTANEKIAEHQQHTDSESNEHKDTEQATENPLSH